MTVLLMTGLPGPPSRATHDRPPRPAQPRYSCPASPARATALLMTGLLGPGALLPPPFTPAALRSRGAGVLAPYRRARGLLGPARAVLARDRAYVRSEVGGRHRRIRLHLLGRAGRDQPAEVQHEDRVADRHHQVHPVLDHDHAGLAGQRLDQVAELGQLLLR